jgi:hypothetical protein
MKDFDCSNRGPSRRFAISGAGGIGGWLHQPPRWCNATMYLDWREETIFALPFNDAKFPLDHCGSHFAASRLRSWRTPWGISATAVLPKPKMKPGRGTAPR